MLMLGPFSLAVMRGFTERLFDRMVAIGGLG